jgi:hypothetical protein
MNQIVEQKRRSRDEDFSHRSSVGAVILAFLSYLPCRKNGTPYSGSKAPASSSVTIKVTCENDVLIGAASNETPISMLRLFGCLV